VGREFYATAVEMVASGAAAGSCLALSQPNRTRADELAAALLSNLAALAGGDVRGCARGSAADGTRVGGSLYKCSSALLLGEVLGEGGEGEGAEGLAARDAWPVELHCQMERAVRLHERQLVAAKRREVEREEAAAKKGGGEGGDGEGGNGNGEGEGDGEDDGGSFSGSKGEEPRSSEREVQQVLHEGQTSPPLVPPPLAPHQPWPPIMVWQVVLKAYEGRPASQGPEPIVMKQGMVKALVAVAQLNPHAAFQNRPLSATGGHAPKPPPKPTDDPPSNGLAAVRDPRSNARAYARASVRTC
jgi:hypothetical protein